MTLENGKTNPRLTAPRKQEQTPPAPHDISGVFGGNIKQERLRRGLTQEKLAEKATVSVDTIKRYESGKYAGIRLDLAYHIADALCVPLQTLLPPQQRNYSLEHLLYEAETIIRSAREAYTTK